MDVTIDSDTLETFDFTSITPSALDTTEEKNKEETAPKTTRAYTSKNNSNNTLRTSPQNIVTVHVVEATIHEEPSTTTKTTRQKQQQKQNQLNKKNHQHQHQHQHQKNPQQDHQKEKEQKPSQH